MKLCINSGCKHELDDYQERCPYCGLSQKAFKIDKSDEKRNADLSNTTFDQHTDFSNEAFVPHKERNAFVSIWLYFSIVANVLVSLINFFPKQAWGSNYPDAAIPLSIVSGVFGVINIIAIIMLLNWRKSGFLLLIISSIIGGLLAMLTSSFPVELLGIVVWYFILQIKKDGKSCWEQLS